MNAEMNPENALDSILKKQPGGLAALLQQMNLYSEKTIPSELQTFKSKYEEFVLVGIGGSSLGVRVWNQTQNLNNFHFLDNVDAQEFERLLKRLDLKKTGFLFISKSGQTIETLAALDYLSQQCAKNSLNLAEQSIVITENKPSELFQWSQKNSVPFFEVPLSVGGRFSVLSSVGLIPAYLMGIDLKKIAAGAHRAIQDRKTILNISEQALASFSREEWITVLWSYCSGLQYFGFWWQQLWAESLAKKTDLADQPAARVSTPLPLIGSTDQHSVLQQIMEGAADKFIIFLKVNEAERGTLKLSSPQFQETSDLKGKTLGALLQAERSATSQALKEANVSQMTIAVENTDPENVAYLMMLFQLVVMTLGESLKINTFNQPGVERGKVLAKKNLQESHKSLLSS